MIYTLPHVFSSVTNTLRFTVALDYKLQYFKTLIIFNTMKLLVFTIFVKFSRLYFLVISFYSYWYNNGFLFPDLGTVFLPIDDADIENGCLKVVF